MNKPNYDLVVAYRTCPVMSKSAPPVHAQDKFKLTELCAHSFKAAVGDLRVRIYVQLDKCPPQYEELFRRLWPAEDLTVIHYPGLGNLGTLAKQMRLLATEQTDGEFVYFAEDDYVYLPGEFPKALNFLRENPDVDFISLYDHLDHHNTDLHRLSYQTRMHGGREWRTSLSTTGTFLGRRETSRECLRTLLSLTEGNSDLGVWMALTKGRVFNPFAVLRWLIPHKFWAGSILYAWRYAWRQILFGRRYSLWFPRPSIATHMVAGLEAPDIDWQKEFREQQARIPRP